MYYARDVSKPKCIIKATTYDTPGWLASCEVLKGGGIINRLGTYTDPTGNATRPLGLNTGVYVVPHNVGHANYVPIATAKYERTGTYNTAHIESWNNTSVTVRITKLDKEYGYPATVLTDGGFTLVLMGQNQRVL